MGKRRFRWDRLASVLVTVMLMALFLWIAASYFDIIMHNSAACPVYQEWNLFTKI